MQNLYYVKHSRTQLSHTMRWQCIDILKCYLNINEIRFSTVFAMVSSVTEVPKNGI